MKRTSKMDRRPLNLTLRISSIAGKVHRRVQEAENLGNRQWSRSKSWPGQHGGRGLKVRHSGSGSLQVQSQHFWATRRDPVSKQNKKVGETGRKARRRKRRKPKSLQVQGLDVHHHLRPSLRIASRWTSVYSFEMGINNNYLRFTDKDERNTHWGLPENLYRNSQDRKLLLLLSLPWGKDSLETGISLSRAPPLQLFVQGDLLYSICL